MVLFAFSLQDQVEKYGAYVGDRAFFGLAILSLLYFAQAREVKRLREWAGRAPERARELEARPSQHAEEALRAPAARPRAAAPPAPAPPAPVAGAANGAVKLKPAEVAALAFARAAGVHEPHAPQRRIRVPAAALAAAPAAEVAAAGAAEDVAHRRRADAAAGRADAAPAGNGHGTGDVPAARHARRAPRRAAPPPPPRVAPQPRRPPPPRRPAVPPAAARERPRARSC